MRRKTEKEKILQGTLRPDRRNRTASDVTSHGLPRMPRGLSPEVQRVWRRIVPQVVEHGLAPVDSAALADLCVCLVRLQEAEALIAGHGILIEGYRGSLVKNPAIAAAQSYRQALLKWTARFGLDPASRGKLVVPAGQDREPSLHEILFAAVTDDNTD